jgi:CBS domain-containing protein
MGENWPVQKGLPAQWAFRDPLLGEVLTKKDSSKATNGTERALAVGLPCQSSVLEAVELLKMADTGSVLVTDHTGKDYIGIFTERDYLNKIAAPNLDPASIKVGDVMREPIWVHEDETVLHALVLMLGPLRTRHLPVIFRETYKFAGTEGLTEEEQELARVAASSNVVGVLASAMEQDALLNLKVHGAVALNSIKGVVSLGDCITELMQQSQLTTEFLYNYINGVGYGNR